MNERTYFEKLCAGHDPKLTRSDLMHIEEFGLCGTECTDMMKSMGMCACWNIECQKINDGPAAMANTLTREVRARIARETERRIQDGVMRNLISRAARIYGVPIDLVTELKKKDERSVVRCAIAFVAHKYLKVSLNTVARNLKKNKATIYNAIHRADVSLSDPESAVKLNLLIQEVVDTMVSDDDKIKMKKSA